MIRVSTIGIVQPRLRKRSAWSSSLPPWYWPTRSACEGLLVQGLGKDLELFLISVQLRSTRCANADGRPECLPCPTDPRQLLPRARCRIWMSCSYIQTSPRFWHRTWNNLPLAYMPPSAKQQKLISTRKEATRDKKPSSEMSKLSEPLKALINAAHSKPHTLPAPRQIASVYGRFADDAGKRGVGLSAWLTASVCPTIDSFPITIPWPCARHPYTAARLTLPTDRCNNDNELPGLPPGTV